MSQPPGPCGCPGRHVRGCPLRDLADVTDEEIGEFSEPEGIILPPQHSR